MIKKDRHPLSELAHEAFEEATPHHKKMMEEVSNYKNGPVTGQEQYGIDSREVGGSLEFPQSGEIVDRLVPAFKSELVRVELRPQKTRDSDDDIEFVEALGDILEQHEEAGNESLINESIVAHFLIAGNFVSKIVYDDMSHTVRAPVIPPWSFAPSAECGTDLDMADYVVHRTHHTDEHIRTFYPNAPITTKKSVSNNDSTNVGNNVVDELWINADYAKSADLAISDMDDKANMITAWVVKRYSTAGKTERHFVSVIPICEGV